MYAKDIYQEVNIFFGILLRKCPSLLSCQSIKRQNSSTAICSARLTAFRSGLSCTRRSGGSRLRRGIRTRRAGLHPVKSPQTSGRICRRLGFEPRRTPVKMRIE